MSGWRQGVRVKGYQRVFGLAFTERVGEGEEAGHVGVTGYEHRPHCQRGFFPPPNMSDTLSEESKNQKKTTFVRVYRSFTV